MCMSLKTAEFLELRKKSLLARRDRMLVGSNSNVETLSEIAAALKSTSMVNGKSRYMRNIDVVGHGRTHALLAG